MTTQHTPGILGSFPACPKRCNFPHPGPHRESPYVPARLLHDLQALGITLQPHGDKLRFYPREAITAELLAGIKEHKTELLRLLAGPEPLGDLQAQDDDDNAPEGITPSPDGGTIIEQHDHPAPQSHSRRLAGNGFPPFPHAPMDPRIIASPVVMCPTCNAARVLVELRTMSGGLCWDCHQREQQPTRPKLQARDIDLTRERAT